MKKPRQILWISGLCGCPFCDFNVLEPFVHVNVDGQIFHDVLQCWPPPPCSTRADISLRGSTVSNIISASLLHKQACRSPGTVRHRCVCVLAQWHTHIHSGRHVCHSPRGDVSMWKSLGDVSSYVSLCSLFVSHKIKLATFESHGKCVQCLLKL